MTQREIDIKLSTLSRRYMQAQRWDVVLDNGSTVNVPADTANGARKLLERRGASVVDVFAA